MTDRECIVNLADRRNRFEYLVQDTDFSRIAIAAGWSGILTCPCCGYPTLLVRDSYDVCTICDWEDDGQDDPESDEIFGGANGDYSLQEARLNFCNHMTMYRPDDALRFSKTAKSAPERERLCRALSRLLESRDFAPLLESIVEAERQLSDLKGDV